ncbi:MAG: filamentous hemagglutinin N-terminal domain-containing protein, partial [Xenococcus sp. MO_188.B8]|nr:filamentous hemagglutinin N-terminal domain-containing protein [Xenococcus sp. MO_188.B8]
MIKQRLSLLLSLNFLTLSQGIFLKPARSQVTPDGTTNTRVDVSGNDFTIQEGNRAGSNLFHSFQDFSVPNGGSAFFNNAADIANILSRVTGGNISNIDGLIRANGSANLFLLNPAGILFGSGARLDIGGSFLGSTADSLLFPDGEFSATDLDNPPLLTINAPIGLGFRDEPAPITNRFDTGSVILEVPPGANLTLVGGDINFENIGLIARRGRVDLGGLSEAGIVTINENGSLSFPDGIERADVTFTNNAFVSVRAGGGGSITVNARNVELSEGEIGGSFFLAGIARDSGSSTAQAGDITINATDNISLDGSEISNEVRSLGEGQGGDINITANSVSLSNGSALSSDINPEGQGDAGNIIINATESISFSGVGSDGFGSRILARVRQEATGTGGDVNITTETLSFNRGNILAGAQGEGDGGNITINANNIVLDGSEIRSSVASTGIGNAGSIQITTDSLSLANDTVLRTNIDRDGQGNAGRIEINANSVFLSGGSEFLSGTGGQGNAGNIIINATESISFSGVGSDGFGSGIFARVSEGATGNGGDVNITTTNLSLAETNQIVNDTNGNGNAGNVTIKASNILLDGPASGIRSAVFSSGVGNAGNINITTDSLALANGASLNTNTGGRGDAGTVEINANSVSLSNGSVLSSDTRGQGDAGNIIIIATDSISFDGDPSGIFARVRKSATGNGGNVELATTNLSLTDGAQI